MELDICCPTTPRHVSYPSVVDIISDSDNYTLPLKLQGSVWWRSWKVSGERKLHFPKF